MSQNPMIRLSVGYMGLLNTLNDFGASKALRYETCSARYYFAVIAQSDLTLVPKSVLEHLFRLIEKCFEGGGTFFSPPTPSKDAKVEIFVI